MTDVQWLFAILAGLYIWECVGWVRRGGVVFTSWLGKRFGIRHPTLLLGNQSGGFTLAAPFPPLGTYFQTQQLPFSLGPKGLLLFVATNFSPGWRPPQSAQFFNWEDVAKFSRRGKKICFDAKVVISVANQSGASAFLKALREIAQVSIENRTSAIEEFLARGIHLGSARDRYKNFQLAIKPIRTLTNLLFALLFFVTPFLTITVGFRDVWLPVLVLLLAGTIVTASIFARIHRRFYPDAEDERFTQTALVALAPATSLRAHDYISRFLLIDFHPITVAELLLAPTSFRAFARRVLLDLRQPALPVCPNPTEAAQETEFFHRQTILRLLQTALKSRGRDFDEICRPPKPTEKTNLSYCPRCESQFESCEVSCSDCGGLPLIPFTKVS